MPNALNKSIRRNCSLRAHLYESYHLIYVPCRPLPKLQVSPFSFCCWPIINDAEMKIYLRLGRARHDPGIHVGPWCLGGRSEYDGLVWSELGICLYQRI